VKLGVADPCTTITVLPPSARAVTFVTTFSAALAPPASSSIVANAKRETRLMTAP
jgi:hypothetical protein